MATIIEWLDSSDGCCQSDDTTILSPQGLVNSPQLYKYIGVDRGKAQQKQTTLRPIVIGIINDFFFIFYTFFAILPPDVVYFLSSIFNRYNYKDSCTPELGNNVSLLKEPCCVRQLPAAHSGNMFGCSLEVSAALKVAQESTTAAICFNETPLICVHCPARECCRIDWAPPGQRVGAENVICSKQQSCD